MSTPTDSAENVVAEWRAAMEGVPDGPWLYRSKRTDDWGIVRGPDDAEGLSSFVFQVRSGFQSEDELAAHRAAKTDPWGAMAKFIARSSPSGISGLLDLLESQRAELAREHTESARRLACMDRRADRLIELTDALAKAKAEYDGLLSTWVESRERHLNGLAKAQGTAQGRAGRFIVCSSPAEGGPAMDRAHTKGPWVLDGHDMSSVLKCVVPKGDPKACHLTGDYDIIARCFSDNWRNDARLIMAAPDMFEALLQARDWLEGWVSAEPQLAIINAALAKAEGLGQRADAPSNPSPAQEG